MNYLVDDRHGKTQKLIKAFAVFCLLAIVVSLSTGKIANFGLILGIPIFLIYGYGVLRNPIVLFYTIFTLNYYTMGILKYVEIPGISVLFDILIYLNILMAIMYGIIFRTLEVKQIYHIVTGMSLIWMVYCIGEIANPTGLFEGWYLSRTLIYGAFITSILTSVQITKISQIDTLLNLFAVFTLTAFVKCMIQVTNGFDASEMEWMTKTGAIKTHIIASGNRYFSFFTDAGNFGSNMGGAGAMFLIISLGIKEQKKKIFYIITGLAALWAMMLSGTRGAMIVPLAALAMYIVLSKNYRSMAIGAVSLSLIYIFFAYTFIGEGNAQISRMRTAFRPNDDPSYLVRKANKEILSQYLRNKPFGEGLGLGGFEGQKLAMRVTTMIPHDSWYVKMWQETGVVGLSIFIMMEVFIIGRCSYVIMFKIRNRELRMKFAGMICGIVGMMLSAYGNAFLGQFPTYITIFTFCTLTVRGEFFDKQLEPDDETKKLEDKVVKQEA